MDLDRLTRVKRRGYWLRSWGAGSATNDLGEYSAEPLYTYMRARDIHLKSPMHHASFEGVIKDSAWPEDLHGAKELS